MTIPFNTSIIGELNGCPNQVIAIAKHTANRNPVVQLTTTREIGESDDSFIYRLRINLRSLIATHGHNHHLTLYCRDKSDIDELTNDEDQNISRKLWYISDNNQSQADRVKALSLILDTHYGICRH